MAKFSNLKSDAIKALALAGVSFALGMPAAYAQSAGAPQRTQLNNARLTTSGTIANTEARGVQGASGGGSGGVSIGGFRLRGGGSRTTSSLEAGVSAGGVDIQGALLRNVDITASGTVSNSLANGGSLNAGGVLIR